MATDPVTASLPVAPFRYSRQRLSGRDLTLERAFEILPGATSWTILIGMVGLGFAAPWIAAMLVIAFDIYWLLRLFYMTFFLVLSSMRLFIEQRTDWMARVRELDEWPHRALRAPGAAPTLADRLSAWMYHRAQRALHHTGSQPPRMTQIYHVVLVPVVKESDAIVEPGLRSLLAQTFPASRILVVIALESRAPAEVQVGMRRLHATYREHFLDLLIVVHPDGVPGEARVKGANVTHAAKHAAEVCAQRGMPLEHVVVSCFDADTIVSPQYIACLTYHFQLCPERTRASFQPIPVYHNNIWDAPGVARVLDIGSSFFQLVEATNPEKLVTFSSHSISFRALVDAGYWPVDMISDDSAIFWKAFITFGGRYQVIPMYVTVSMDVVDAGSWWKTIRNVYRQKRRWAWGVENFPLVMRGFLVARDIPLIDKFRHGFKLLAGHVAWATWPFLLGVIGWLPAVFAEREFSSSVLYYSAPRVTAMIFSLSSLALVTTMILSVSLLPKHRVPDPWLKKLGHACEWLFVPIIAIFLSALPALEAQTRLMFGRSIEFWVTEKPRRRR